VFPFDESVEHWKSRPRQLAIHVRDPPLSRSAAITISFSGQPMSPAEAALAERHPASGKRQRARRNASRSIPESGAA
jgi:hypothetical protein